MWTAPLAASLRTLRYWPTWLFVGILRGLMGLPLKYRLRVGRTLGRLFSYISPRRRHIAAVNIELCFPELSPPERRGLLGRHFQAIGMGTVETAMTWFASDDELRALGRVEGLEHIREAQAKGNGVIMLCGHFTYMELITHMLGLYTPLGAVYRPMKNPVFDAFIRRARESRSAWIISREQPLAMLRSLRANQAIAYMPDQDYGLRYGTFVPFFGVPAATITTTSRFARTTGALVVPYVGRRLENGGGYVVTVLPALEGFPSGDDEADARRINALIEDQVRLAPEQYLWVHRRFKNRPEGVSDPYPRRLDWEP